MKFFVAFFAPAREVSPDPEVAEVVIEASGREELDRATVEIIKDETDSLETWLGWKSSPGASGKPFAVGIHVKSVIELAATVLNAELSAADVLKWRGPMAIPPVESIQTAEQARETAVEWQHWQSRRQLDWNEMHGWADFFEVLGKKFDLTDEFKENGII